MGKRIFYFICLIIIISLLSYGSKSFRGIEEKNNEVIQYEITKRPSPETLDIEKINELPEFNPKSFEDYKIDLSGKDLRDVDLTNRSDDLKYAWFNSKTIWPQNLPKDFDPEKIMEYGKDPGLDIRLLHNSGITGKGVNIGIIDYPLLVDHTEYKERIKLYEEIGINSETGSYHGGMTASIAVGKTVGVAPEANLYFIGVGNTENDGSINHTSPAKAILRLLEINETLSEDNKIKVISLSMGWKKGQKGYNEVISAVNKAKSQGVFVVSSMLNQDYEFFFDGLGRDPMSDPNDINSYEPGILFRDYYYKSNNILQFFEERVEKKMNRKCNIEEILYIPMDSRAFASPFSIDDYMFERRGGWSMCSPYIAGLYALCYQVNPEITPKMFWDRALKTGDSITVDNNDFQIKMQKLVNPNRLISLIQDN